MRCFLLLFGEVVFLGFGWMLLDVGGCAWASHPPAPLERGDLDAVFLLVMSDLWRLDSPLVEGRLGALFFLWDGVRELFSRAG